MRNIVIRAYKPEDFIDIVDSSEPMVENREEQWAYAFRHAQIGHNETFEVDGKVALVGGFIEIWPGTAEVWLKLSEDFKHSSAIVVMIRKRLDAWIGEQGFDRVQALCKRNWMEGRRFLEWLGMSYEGTLRKMGPHGEDQTLYARVR